MGSMVVSCVSGRGINELRNIIFDVASQVRENTGTCSDLDGRGIGCGHILAGRGMGVVIFQNTSSITCV